jgi:hypothetical protein
MQRDQLNTLTNILYDYSSHNTVTISDVASEKHNVVSAYVRGNYVQI